MQLIALAALVAFHVAQTQSGSAAVPTGLKDVLTVGSHQHDVRFAGSLTLHEPNALARQSIMTSQLSYELNAASGQSPSSMQLVFVDNASASELVDMGLPIQLGIEDHSVQGIGNRDDLVVVSKLTGDLSRIPNAFSVRDKLNERSLQMLFQFLKGKVTRVAVIRHMSTGTDEFCPSYRQRVSEAGMQIVWDGEYDEKHMRYAIWNFMVQDVEAVLLCLPEDLVAHYLQMSKALSKVVNNYTAPVTLTVNHSLERIAGTMLNGGQDDRDDMNNPRWDAMWLLTALCGPPTYWMRNVVSEGNNAAQMDRLMNQSFFEQFRRQRDLDAISVGAMQQVLLHAYRRHMSGVPWHIAAVLRYARIPSYYGVLETGGNINAGNGCLLMQYQEEPVVVHDPSYGTPTRPFVFPAPAWDVRNCTIPADMQSNVGFDSAGNCRACPGQAAMWDTASQRRLCENCPAGRSYIRISSESGMCAVACPVAQVPDLEGQKCLDCEVGRYADLNGAMPRCVDCPLGTISERGQSSCTQCARGKYQSWEFKGLRCVECESGTVASNNGSFACMQCDDGYFASEPGMSECSRCGAGQVNTAARDSCNVCPAGKYTTPGRQNCIHCPVGSFQRKSGQTECVQDNACCYSPLHGMDEPYNRDGYYTLEYSNVEICALPNACLKNSTCAEGSLSRQCFACAPGYFADGGCKKCPPRVLNIVAHVLHFVAASFFYQLFVIAAMSAANKPESILTNLVKLFFNHCIQIAILLRSIKMYSAAQGKSGFIIDDFGKSMLSYVSMFTQDGLLDTDSTWLSTSCILQFAFSDKEQQAFDQLNTATHEDYYSPELADARATFQRYQWKGEVYTLIFWNSAPFVFVFIGLIVNYLKVYKYMHKKGKIWRQAPRFLTQLFFFKPKEVTDMYEVGEIKGFVEVYNISISGMYWPIHHVGAWVKRRTLCSCKSKLNPITWLLKKLGGGIRYHRIALRQFWIESLPMMKIFVWMLSFPIASRSMRPLRCITLGSSGEHSSVMLTSGAVECYSSDPGLMIVSGCLALFSAVILPTLNIRSLFQDYKRYGSVPKSQAILATGYRKECFWWEALHYVRKFMLQTLGFLEMAPTTKFFIFTNIGVAFMGLHSAVQPYDRFGMELQILERDQLIIFTLLSLFMVYSNISLFGTLFFIFTVVHALYTCKILYLIGYHSALDYAESLDPESVNQRKDGTIKKIQSSLLEWHTSLKQQQPYVSYDILHGFMTVVGSRGDQAASTYIPRGNDCADHCKDGKSRLSEAPAVPDLAELGRVHQASASQKVLLGSMIMDTVKFITLKSGATSSVTVLDFALRAAFVMASDLSGKQQASSSGPDPATEVDPMILVAAVDAADPIMLTHQPHEEGEEEEEEDPRLIIGDVDLSRKCRLIQKDLRIHQSRIVEQLGEWHMCQLIKRKVARQRRSVTASDFQREGDEEDDEDDEEDDEGEQEHQNEPKVSHVVSVMDDDDHEDENDEHDTTDHVPTESKEQMEERLQVEIERMFTPAMFRRGLLMQDLEKGLSAVQKLDQSELTMMLDLFERMWMLDKLNEDRSLRALCGWTEELSMNTDDEQLALTDADGDKAVDFGKVPVLWGMMAVALLRRDKHDVGLESLQVVQIRRLRRERIVRKQVLPV